MSRSYRNTPIHGHGGGSEKEDKRIANRCLRSAVRRKLRTCSDFEAVELPLLREVSNPWSMNKDGKSYDDQLAAFKHTLRKETRTRGGRQRKYLFITEATREYACREHERMALHFGWPMDEALWQNYVLSLDVEFYLSCLRK